MIGEPTFLSVGEGAEQRRIAVRLRQGDLPGLMWLGGFKSDMGGTKAAALDRWAEEHGRAYVRFDYSGHGESSGAFTDGTIGRWLEESLAVFEACCRGPQVLVGSSMGGWLALLLVREVRRRAAFATPFPQATPAGLVLIAPAVDFTEEGRRHLLLCGLIETGCPVRILQGVKDPDVPWRHAVELVSRLAHDDVILSLVKDGDHRLSRAEDIERLIHAVAEF